ncbi:RAVE protein 1 C terminal family protein [Acanthocheilonema viteae]
MNVHQILTGALNRGDEVFSVGTIDDLSFTACAVGTNVVIFSSSFERVQVITPPSCAEGLLVNCVAACCETGKIVATYSGVVRIYEPITRTEDGTNGFTYHWVETYSLLLKYTVDKIHWSLQGLRLLICGGDALHLYQNLLLSAALDIKLDTVTFGIIEEENESENEAVSFWDCVWSQKLAAKPRFVASSPDGAYFATCGISDCLVKIWFQREESSGSAGNRGNGVSFGFSYVQHPQPVAGFEWRKVPRYMSRQYVQNALLTWCEDKTVRIWKEAATVSLDFQTVISNVEMISLDKNPATECCSKKPSLRATREKIRSFLKKIVERKALAGEIMPPTRSSVSRNTSLYEIASGKHTDSGPAFYLCTTINAQNDCLLVPSLETSADQRPFMIHWLNNKAIVYDTGVERIMVEALSSDCSAEPSEIENSVRKSVLQSQNLLTESLHSNKGHNIDDTKVASAGPMQQNEVLDDTLASPVNGATRVFSNETTSLKDSMDLKLNILIREWKKSTDILFAVHPADGSLLTWTVEWLDDPLRQPTVSFTSRFPSAFSLSDAMSLNPSLRVYYPQNFLHEQFTEKYASGGISQIFERRNTNLLYLLTHHNNGSLNLWNLTFEDNEKFNTVVNISHASRMCGHRYKISQVIAHPVLPLVLTTSHYNYITQNTEETGKAELILWKVNPVGPLCKCGGIRELARMTSNSSDAFTAVTWLPLILSSSLLGSLSTSPSSSFVANSSGHINIYQAIVDAAEFLADIHASGRKNVSPSESSCSTNSGKAYDIRNKQNMTKSYDIQNKQNMKKMFKVVSTQSSTKPGCILLLSSINAASCADNVLLIHAFNERLLISKDGFSGTTDTSQNLATEGTNVSRYYLVLFEKEKDFLTRLRMWLINIGITDFEGEIEDALPAKYSSDSVNVTVNENSLSKLQLSTNLIYDDHVILPDGVSVVLVEPAAGHLPSSNLYPTCRAPYHVLLACSDENVRFYECIRIIESGGSISYKWKTWGMISSTMDSNIEMDGQIYSISAAHSNRFACAYFPEGMTNATSSISSIKVGVFECESSGGVEWLCEDTIIVNLRHRMKEGAENYLGRSDTAVSEFCTGMPINNVCLKWVSAEDGSHILTVALGTYIFLYTQVSQGAAQRNIVMMKEHDTYRRGPLRKASSLANPETISTRLVRWLCIRFLELKSADSLPPLPTTLGWVRDGLLIIGMQSEMRCYSQWNFKAEFPKKKLAEVTKDLSRLKSSSHLALAGLGISSYSSLDQLSKKFKQEPVPLNKQKLYKDLLQRMYSAPYDLQTLLLKDEHVLEAISEEGLFEAARLASPILPQYHPKLLIELLNSGRTRVVKAILLHVLKSLKQLNVSIPNPLSRASSMRKMSLTSGDLKMEDLGQDATRGLSDTFDDSNLEYDELDGIPPLPLHILISAGDPFSVAKEKASEISQDDSLDASLDVDNEPRKSRQNSFSMDNVHTVFVSTSFTARHNRLLTEFLTHTHLPGLSSVDQMHLLAVADTLSHFSSDIMDKLTQANAAFQATQPQIVSDAAGGYATPTVGFETVDECGLRYLMAMKQHEYLLLCLPLQQKHSLRSRGLSPSQIIWALHSETETELLNAIPCLQKPTLSWEELRSLGIAWWLKNTSSLRAIIEKLAKAAFQKNQDPLDASLYYLLLKKKNLLTHLFKSVKDNRMLDFFMHDFNEEKWKKAALKNAFVLMGKQRFQHAAAFFLLAGSIKDAIQMVLRKLQDLQLAIIIVRLYERDYEEQGNLLRELLCREIFGAEVADVKDFDVTSRANRNPFVRSMAYWHMKEYVRAANTLVDEAGRVHLDASMEYSLSDIFNFYSFIRIHHLVIRQRLLNAGIQVGSTEKFLTVAKQLASVITPSERRLYFRTASAHMASGCPLLALDVLERLPKNLTVMKSSSLSPEMNKHTRSELPKNDDPWNNRSNAIDWNVLTSSAHVHGELNLQLNGSEIDELVVQKESIAEVISHYSNRTDENNATLDVIAQHMKFTATLRLLVEELSTLASAFEVDGGQLRLQLLNWLEAGASVLQKICGNHRSDYSNLKLVDITENEDEFNDDIISDHKTIHINRAETGSHYVLHHRRWLRTNQKLLRAFISYCTLHNSQSHRLTAALMELLLLQMEVQQDSRSSKLFTGESLPVVHSFPLFIASVSPHRMFVSSPLSFVKSLCSDILLSLVDLSEPPQIESSLTKVYKVYSLCQGLSSCVYQSLCSVSNIYGSSHGALARLSRVATANNDCQVMTSPSKWPGVDNLLAILSREKDEEAPQLRLLMLETYIAVFASLFAYALATYDARWLFRLAARNIGTKEFAILFGGGGKKTQKVAPSRPPGPLVKRTTTVLSGLPSNETHTESSKNCLPIDCSSFRASLNTEVIGVEATIISSDGFPANKSRSLKEQVPYEWIPPKKSMVQFFAEKPELSEILDGCYDSDEEHHESVIELEEQLQKKQHSDSEGFAWWLLRLALTHQQLYRMKSFLQLAGLEYSELPALSPRANAVFKLIENWTKQLEDHLYTMPDGCPSDLLPDLSIRKDDGGAEPLLKKYSVLTETNNTPFECVDPSVLPVKRIWLYLVRQDHILPLFIKHIFGFGDQQEESMVREGATELENRDTVNVFKIVQREHEPIASFCCSEVRPGWLVVSNTRELQEMDITALLDNAENLKLSSWLFNRTELDVALDGTKRDVFKDNDDYQLITENGLQATTINTMYKRQVNGIRRLDSHPTMPYYVSGSSDGSIRMWEWGVGQPFFTPRIAGQYAKVTKVLFSFNGSKFASVDNDGILCLWQTTQGLPIKKPFFNQKCHSKSAADVRFLGSTSSVLVTAGLSLSDENINLWDTLMPQSKALIHSWTTHPEGATSVMYLSSYQTIVSGGRHGELCVWDVRQRRLRTTVKCFENSSVKCLVSDPFQQIIVAGSNDGDIKVWNADLVPQLVTSLDGEHVARGGFSLRQVASVVQGVQQLYVDPEIRLFSCGADCSLKIRSLRNMT